jgi:DivIVA domain-containing protein
MTTVLQYLVIAAVVAAVLFGIALFVFGRGEQLAPLPARTSPVDLPERNISGDDVRGVRFAMAARGYRMSDVDWALERLADELDRTRARLAEVDPNHIDADTFVFDPDQQDLFADDEPFESTDRDGMTDSDQAEQADQTDAASAFDDQPTVEQPSAAEPTTALRVDPARTETDER